MLSFGKELVDTREGRRQSNHGRATNLPVVSTPASNARHGTRFRVFCWLMVTVGQDPCHRPGPMRPGARPHGAAVGLITDGTDRSQCEI